MDGGPGFAVGGGVRNQKRIGKGGNQIVPPYRLHGRRMPDIIGKCGKHKQTAFVNRLPCLFAEAQTFQPPCRAQNDRLPAAQQNIQAILLHRREEAAHCRHSRIAQGTDGVKCFDDNAAGTLNRANQAQQTPTQNRRFAQRNQLRRRIFEKAVLQNRRVIAVSLPDYPHAHVFVFPSELTI
jgi:hypothetical protein